MEVDAAAGERAAAMYTLIVTDRLNEVDPESDATADD